jgi:rRNA biogenesis protein RRP5
MRKNRDISSDPNYWLNYATFLMTTLNRPDDARALLQRSTQSLPTHHHAHLISRFGALEFESPHGDIERGRTIFEGLVDTYKNSYDLWDQYLAQELGAHGDVERARALFERMAKMKMRPKRAKYVFKRWLSWEKKLADEGAGNDKNVARVKVLAEEYVEGSGMKRVVAGEIDDQSSGKGKGSK